MAGQPKCATPVAVTQLVGSLCFSFVSILRRAAEITRQQKEAELKKQQEYRKAG